MNEITQALWIHSASIAVAVIVSALILRSRGLFTFFHTGFWVTLAMAVYFVYNPVSTLLSGDLGRYREALYLMTHDRTDRIYWILTVILSGFAVYIIVYIRNRTKESEAALIASPMSTGEWTISRSVVLGLFFVAAIYSLFYFRAAGLLGNDNAIVEYDKGRIVGGATGYSVVAHAFFLYIVAILLLRGKRTAHAIGWASAIIFVLIKLYDSHVRWIVVSLIVVLGMAEFIRFRVESSRAQEGEDPSFTINKKHMKTALIVIGAAIMALFLTVRGHSSIANVKELSLNNGHEELRKADTAMLPVLYVESKLAEINGYDFGIPLISQVVLGWLPRKYFPWKGELEKILLDRGPPRLTISVNTWLFASKSTVIGSFYNHGGMIGTLLGMAFIGLLSRRLDLLIAAGKTDLGRAVGIVWMSSAWMMFASSDIWIVQNLFINAMPFFGLWIVSKIFPDKASDADETVCDARRDGVLKL